MKSYSARSPEVRRTWFRCALASNSVLESEAPTAWKFMTFLNINVPLLPYRR